MRCNHLRSHNNKEKHQKKRMKNSRIARLQQRKLLPQTDARPAIERQILPPRPQLLPALGSKLLRVGSIVVRPAVHAPRTVPDIRARFHKDGRRPVWAPAQGQHVIVGGVAAVVGHDGHEAQRLVEDVLEVLHLLDAGVVRALAGGPVLGDLGEQFVPDVRPPREHPPRVSEQAGRRVAAGEQDVEQLAAQRDRVLRLLDQLVQEDVAFRLVVLLQVGRWVVVVARDGFGDNLVGELVHRLDAFGALAVRDPAAEAGALELKGHCFGGVDEAGGGDGVLEYVLGVLVMNGRWSVVEIQNLRFHELGGRIRFQPWHEGVGGPSEEEFCC